jgi:hypothetical protein
MAKLSVYRRAVKMRWPKSYRERQVFGDGRWLVVADEYKVAHEHGYKGFIWTSIYMLATFAEAEDTASSFKNDGAAVQIVDCEEL